MVHVLLTLLSTESNTHFSYTGHIATPKLQQFLDESQSGKHSEVSVLRVQVRGENLVETARKNGPANGDLSQIEEYLGDAPTFILLRATPSTWYVITWMPEGKVGVHSSMVYASTQLSLKAAVGDCVEDLLQFGTIEDVFGKDLDMPSVLPHAAATKEAPSAAIASDEYAISKTSAPAPAPKPLSLGSKKPSSVSPSSTFTQGQDGDTSDSYVAGSTH
ncbi:hypothetical protein H4S06_005933, partial [Coemansia sp. BCRC 34490]